MTPKDLFASIERRFFGQEAPADSASDPCPLFDVHAANSPRHHMSLTPATFRQKPNRLLG